MSDQDEQLRVFSQDDLVEAVNQTVKLASEQFYLSTRPEGWEPEDDDLDSGPELAREVAWYVGDQLEDHRVQAGEPESVQASEPTDDELMSVVGDGNDLTPKQIQNRLNFAEREMPVVERWYDKIHYGDASLEDVDIGDDMSKPSFYKLKKRVEKSGED